MTETLNEAVAGLPALHGTLMTCFEWGTAIAQEVSQDPAGTDLGEPIDGLVG